MRPLAVAIALLTAVGVAGCGFLPMATSPDLIPIAPITASLKCAFAKALLEERAPGHMERLRGRVVAGTLELKVVDDRQLGASVKNAGPFILALTTPLSISPSFSSSYHAVNTIDTKINFRILLEANNLNACQLPGAEADTLGFSSWLAKVIAGLDFNPSAQPRGVVESIYYEGDFAVTRQGSGGLDLNILTISPSLSASASRNDVQNISFTIAPISKDNPAPGKGRGTLGELKVVPPQIKIIQQRLFW
jgi:hypothetical protein